MNVIQFNYIIILLPQYTMTLTYINKPHIVNFIIKINIYYNHVERNNQ